MVLTGTGFNKKRDRRNKIHVSDWHERWGEPHRRAWRDLRDELASPEIFLAPVSEKEKW